MAFTCSRGLFFLLFFTLTFSSSVFMYSRYCVSRKSIEVYYHTQRLNHNVTSTKSSLGQMTFQQRYVVDRTHWSGPKAQGPIFVYFGGMFNIDLMVGKVDKINSDAPREKALIVYIEHRFYGESLPFGSIARAMFNHTVRDCLTIGQALADFANIITGLKANMSSQNSPVFVHGGFYGGILAFEFIMKYPHLSNGGVVSEDLVDPAAQALVSDYFDYNPISPSQWQKCTELMRLPPRPSNITQFRWKCCITFGAGKT